MLLILVLFLLLCCCAIFAPASRPLQVKYILGYSVPRADKVPEQIAHYLEGIDGFVWQEYIMGVSMLT